MNIDFVNKLPKKNNTITKFCYILYNKKDETENSIKIKVSCNPLEFEKYGKVEFLSYFYFNDEIFKLDKVEFKEIEEMENLENELNKSECIKNLDNKFFFECIKKKLLLSEKIYYIYLLRCEDNSIYTGIATDYVRRFKEHINGTGAKYTKFKKPEKIECVFSTLGKSHASKIEAQIKKLKKNEKEELIKTPHNLQKIYPDIKIVQISN